MSDPLRLRGYDAVTMWVGNAKQAAHFHRTALGFSVTAYAGPETGIRDRASYLLQQGAIRLVMSSGLQPDSEVVAHHARHGDAVKDIAFEVTDATLAFEVAVARGAMPLTEPSVHEDENGQVIISAIGTFGETIHSFVERGQYAGTYLPGFVPVDDGSPAAPAGLTSLDHVVANVERGQMAHWVRFYEQILDFAPLRHFNDDDIATADTALMSKVLGDGQGRIKIPINEPATRRKRSQIEEFLDAHGGPGIQHLALTTEDIIHTVARLRQAGVSFLQAPSAYYEDARQRVGDIHESWEELATLGILVDRDEEGYLLQIFTEPLQDRPTMFYEIIQRRGSTGFGVGNFRALFEAIERAQQRRGNL